MSLQIPPGTHCWGAIPCWESMIYSVIDFISTKHQSIYIYAYMYTLCGYLYAHIQVLILLSQGQCEHTHAHTQCHVPYPQNSRWYICQQIRSCRKINQFTSRPRLIDFFIMAILHFSLHGALGQRFPPFSHQPVYNHPCQVINDINI